jgi:sugar lactone lactonase YvrE
MPIRLLRRPILLVLALAFAAAAPLAWTSGPTFWTIATAADFLRGTSDGVYVSLNGVVSAGPQLSNRLTTTAPQIWSLAEAPDGTLYAGTGGDGRVLRLRAGQPEATAFDATENNVFAIAISGTRVYAATSPDGQVYVLEGTAPARPFFDPTEKYIWALATDDAGRVWVGAGNPAVIYRVEPNGTAQPIYRPPAAHVVSLLRDAEGRMLAGTEAPGRLYRFDSSGRPFVMLDSGLTELRAASVNDTGVVFAAAVARGDEPAGGEPSSVASALALAAPGPPAASPSSSSPPARKSVVYRIEPSGTWESMWETTDLVYDVAATDDGGVLVATGPEGRLFKVERTREVLLLTGVDAKQITRFVTSGAAKAPRRLTAFATATPGRVVSVGAGVQSPATYISSVRDSKSVATWGLIRWEGGGNVQMFTRSGNTEKPDDSWTDWTGPYSRRDGEPIKSPAARFLQWRAVLSRPDAAAAAPEVTSVTVAYLPRNTRPTVSSVTVHPPGVVFQRPFGGDDSAIAGLDDLIADSRRPPGDPGPPTPAPGRRMYQKGLQTLQWKAEDGDGDRLTYTLQYRREGDTAWRELRAGLSDPIFVWDTTAVGDGRYVVRVVASDAVVNAADRALTGDRDSEPVVVDNTPPAITTEIVRQGTTARLVVRVRDGLSPIQKVEYSLSGGPWQIVYPADGVADSPEERFEIPLASEADAARMVVRAIDWLQNATSLTVPSR